MNLLTKKDTESNPGLEFVLAKIFGTQEKPNEITASPETPLPQTNNEAEQTGNEQPELVKQTQHTG